jgi:hypothetical protein
MTTPDPTDEQLAAWLLGDLADPEAAEVDLALAQDPVAAARADRIADALGRLDLAAGPPPPTGYAARLDAGLAARLGLGAPGGRADGDLGPVRAVGGSAGTHPGRTRPQGARPAAGGRAGRRRIEQLLPGLAALLLVVAVSAVGLRSFRDGALPADVAATSSDTDPATAGGATPEADPDPDGAAGEEGAGGATPDAGSLAAIATEEPGPAATAGATGSVAGGEDPAGTADPPTGSSGPGSSGTGSSVPGSGPGAGAPDPGPSAGPDGPGDLPGDADAGAGGATGDEPADGGAPGDGPGDGQGGGDDADGPQALTRPEDPPPADPEAAGGDPGTGDEPVAAPAPDDEEAVADEAPQEGAPSSTSSPTIADAQADLPDDDAVDDRYGSRPESAQVVGLSGAEAEERAAAHAAEVRAADDLPSSGEPPDRCLDTALQGQPTAVVVAVESVIYQGEPGLAYLVVRGEPTLDRADVTIVGSGSCTPLLVRDVDA